jgi:hypothetical protein
MADFHPKPHQNTLGQLHQSLDQLKDSLTVCSPVDQSRSRPAPQASRKAVEPFQDDGDWESAFESAAADIDNYFNTSSKA